MRNSVILVGLLVALASVGAHAQHRCWDGEGRVVTSKWSCSDLGLPPAPSAAVVQAERRAAQPERRTAYKCTSFDGGTFYRAGPCPKHASSTVPVIGGTPGSMAIVQGPMQQEIVDRAFACEQARASRERSTARSARAHESMDRRVSELCN